MPDQRGTSAAWPILDEDNKLMGILVLSQPPESGGFSDYAANIASFVASTIEHVIERGFDSLTGLINWPGFAALLDEACGAQSDDSSADDEMTTFLAHSGCLMGSRGSVRRAPGP